MAKKRSKANSAPTKTNPRASSPSWIIWAVLAGVVGIIAIVLIYAYSNTQETATNENNLRAGSANYCRSLPKFLANLNYGNTAALSTSLARFKGLVLYDTSQQVTKDNVFQDETWDDAGYLGNITRDGNGNSYVVPSPLVSLIDNPPALQNRIYRVDSASGKLHEWLTLPGVPEATRNPYGTLGVFYDCDSDSIYVSSVAESSYDEEKGVIYQINAQSGEILNEYQGLDAIGIAVVNWKNEKLLVLGSARKNIVLGIRLGSKGEFTGKAEILTTLGENSDAGLFRVRRFGVDENGLVTLQVSIFDFNLMAPTNNARGNYEYQIGNNVKEWGLIRYNIGN